VSQERTRKHLSEIENWTSELSSLDLDYADLFAQDLSLKPSANLITTRLVSLSMDCDIELINSSDSTSTKSTKSSIKRQFNRQGSQDNASILKQNVLVKNLDLLATQLKSLYCMFENRQEQLRKIAYPQIGKPMQRVEPIQPSESPNQGPSSTTIVLPNIQFDALGPNTGSGSLIKRDSMNKVFILC
jgi:hypothetical protein